MDTEQLRFEMGTDFEEVSEARRNFRGDFD